MLEGNKRPTNGEEIHIATELFFRQAREEMEQQRKALEAAGLNPDEIAKIVDPESITPFRVSPHQRGWA